MRLKARLKDIGLPALNRRRFDAAKERLTEAFDEDPCLKYLLGSDEYDYEKAGNIHKYTLKIGLLYGSVVTTSDSIEGISIWMPPSRIETTPWMFIRSGGLGMKAIPRKDGRTLFEAIRDYGEYSSSIHQKHVPFPHWYLLSMAVGKKYQGQGFAGKLLKPVLRFFDQTGFPCYLETHNPKNIGFYENFGFRVVEIGILPQSDKEHYAMLRQPLR
jgi:ribosomal protein S18 acetylase RimI-like enzyme